MSARSWSVHKFGGTSLGDAERIRRAAHTLAEKADPPVAVIVSAVGGTTDALLTLLDRAAAGDDAYLEELEAVRERHAALADALLSIKPRARFLEQLEAGCRDIRDLAHATALLGKVSQDAQSLVAGFGELWSAQLLASVVVETGVHAEWLDARRVLEVHEGELGPLVQWERSLSRLRELIAADFAGVLVITGFIASDAEGISTTLGRNGSDFSASIFAALFAAREIVIWTDVPGVMSADPTRVPEAQVIEALTYSEAMELAYFGARVLHPQTMAPAIERGIPLYIRDANAPDLPGTRIADHSNPDAQVKGITSIDGMALLNVEGAGMIGVPGTASRLFTALRAGGISVVLISQGSSEHSICVAIPHEHAERAERVVRRAFAAELEQGQIQSVRVLPGASILAVVGDGMAGTPGVAAKVFGALGEAGVNVRAIAQGSSERNISAVVASSEVTRALRAVHASFYLSPQTLSIGLIGPGSVGGTLLSQIAGERERLRRQARLDLRIRALAGSRRMVLADTSLPLDRWRETLEGEGEPTDLERFAAHVQADHIPHSIIVDCTASAAVAARYRDWLAAGIHVVTPNKKAGSADWHEFTRMRDAGRSRAHYLYETTVGAGLPILQTLRDLRETGDEIIRVTGVLSGTLAYLFNQFDGSQPFSALVREAHARGYTEPDPRDDLSGMDVARKVVILGREMGLPLELSQIELEGLVPPELSAGSVEAFLDGLHRVDAEMSQRLASAREERCVLRYVGRLDANGAARVALEQVPIKHSLAHSELTDNIVQFETARYRDNPLVVRGPGAGPEVTAAGVFSDLLRLAAYLGAHL